MSALTVCERLVDDVSAVNRDLNPGAAERSRCARRNMLACSERQQFGLSPRGNGYDDARRGFGEQGRDVAEGAAPSMR